MTEALNVQDDMVREASSGAASVLPLREMTKIVEHGARLVAKVDSAAVQDGFDLYLHGFVVTNDGRWVVVQQNSLMVAHQISLSMGASIA